VWLLVRTNLFIPIRFRLPIRNLTIAVSATWRNAEKSLNRCTSTFSAQTTAVEYSSNLLVIYTKWCANIFRRFLDISKFWTAISWRLWRHLATKKKNHPFRKKIWEPRRNRPINGNAMLVAYKLCTPRTNSAPSSERDK